MGHLGANEYWIASSSDVFDADEPLSAWDALVLRDRMAHLISSVPGYRVNWMARTGGYGLAQNDGDPVLLFPFRFPLTICTPDRPPSLEVRVAGKLSGSATSLKLRARVLWDFYKMESSSEASSQPTLFDATATTTSTSSVWVIDSNATFTSDEDWRSARQHFETDNDGEKDMAGVAMARLEVVIDGTFAGSGACYVTGAVVREFL